jgi:hypothetical protein
MKKMSYLISSRVVTILLFYSMMGGWPFGALRLAPHFFNLIERVASSTHLTRV